MYSPSVRPWLRIQILKTQFKIGVSPSFGSYIYNFVLGKPSLQPLKIIFKGLDTFKMYPQTAN